MSQLEIPAPSTGPSHRLSLSDPTTLTMIGSTLYAIFNLAAPHVGIHVTGNATNASELFAGVINSVGLASKHFLQGKLIVAAAQVGRAAAETPAGQTIVKDVEAAVKADVAAPLAADVAAPPATTAVDARLVPLERMLAEAQSALAALKSPQGS